MHPLYFEDFHPGRVFRTAGVTVTEGMVAEFAFKYDPQPFHIDREMAGRSIYGGIIASGFQTLALTFRLFQQTGVLSAASMGGAGMDEVRWLKPVRPGDTLTVEVEVLDSRPSAKRPDRGSARLKYTTFNQAGEPVQSFVALHILKRRPD